MVKNPPAGAGDTRDAGVTPGRGRSPPVGKSNPLQNSHRENPMTEEPGWLQSMGLQESDLTQWLSTHTAQ